MIAILQWGTLIICSVVLLLRVPDAIRGRNRTVFGIMVLATLCSLLSVPGPYEAIDAALGGWNLTHLILRFIVFAAVLLVGVRVARGLGDPRGHRLITGPAGRWALAVSSVAVAATFAFMDTRGSSVGLLDVADNGGHNAVLAPFYAAAGRTYPAFVSLALLPALLATARSHLPRLVRAGASLTCIGAVAAVLSIPASFAPEAWVPAQQTVNYLAVLGYVLGLGLFWVSGLVAKESGNARATFRKN
ncbi:hypothetical protein [Arthrobacter sp. NicSoilB8]|uniref:hypothetical protein n=1 Tax=Arthrobacter sp. NicSoilB8 TaxID=2830998 RepID=UPI001CC6A4E6|nr:hypothetical protein [Arthrobacter sp. NicSoilB8]BCW69781.1 hypothetical protein NicSoilB8_08250 [Arthrobacter sp. NicSoilB8]